MPTDVEAVSLAERAAATAPSDPAIAWVRIMACYDAATCDIHAASRNMRTLDPGNAAGWVADFRDAASVDAAHGIDGMLADMAADGHFDVYFNALVIRTAEALHAARSSGPTAVPGDDAAQALVGAIGLVSIIPMFQGLGRACTAPETRAARRSECLEITRVMLLGDMSFVQAMGNAIRTRLLKPGTPECEAQQAWLRTFEWRAQQLLAVNARAGYSAQWASEQMSLMRKLPREEDVVLETLRRANIALEPPADWRPDAPPHPCAGP